MNIQDFPPLQAVSNVIELKPDKRYLLVFKGILTVEQVESFLSVLKAQGITCLGVALGTDDELQVIEMPIEGE